MYIFYSHKKNHNLAEEVQTQTFKQNLTHFHAKSIVEAPHLKVSDMA